MTGIYTQKFFKIFLREIMTIGLEQTVISSIIIPIIIIIIIIIITGLAGADPHLFHHAA
jgi:hypothetical protein